MSKPCNCGGVCVNGFGRCPLVRSYPSVATMQAQWAALKAASDAAVSDYLRGLRRGMAIAREWDAGTTDVDWDKAEAQMEREIEEAKR